ncbi:DUF1540 domain-containing protein [Clostridium aestuarii]|uniref:DUF1540 domain-containing protein n=1 Tax=Clostridium aestuarii TaxID=338193 RepID=A0ABT4D1Y0_9CLOT|nr:DUF1540 domain-containing protein [Clostridium aestuarii]MCY6485253.1 DUF1540 domain-containing protein [Clostridium aestuarii]
MQHNNSIHCTVTECKFHCNSDNYCVLSEINVVKNINIASSIECTDCGSFQKK